MEWLSRETKKMLLELSVGVILYIFVLGILSCFLLPKFSYSVLPVLGGLAAGGIGALMMLVHMAVITERTLASQSESYANKTTVVHSLIRKLVLIVALFCLWQWFQIDLLAAVIGAMGMKAGAYLQPLVHKVFGRTEEDRADTESS